MEHRPDARPPQVGRRSRSSPRERCGRARLPLAQTSSPIDTRASADPLDRNWTRSSSAVHGAARTEPVRRRLHAHPAHAVRDRLAADHVADQLDVSPRLPQQPRVVDLRETRTAGQRPGGHEPRYAEQDDRRCTRAESSRRRLRRAQRRRQQARGGPRAAGRSTAPRARRDAGDERPRLPMRVQAALAVTRQREYCADDFLGGRPADRTVLRELGQGRHRRRTRVHDARRRARLERVDRTVHGRVPGP